jgi:hypothetical protein
MPRLERGHRWCAVAAALVWLCLALIATGAHASSSATQEVRAIPAHAMTSQGMPEALDCMPCALCYVAPAPISHVVTVEAKEFESFTWWVHLPSVPAEPQALSDPRYREHVPIRISFCRWLD